MKVPVEGNPGYYRDTESGAIINCSDSEFQAYLNQKQKKLSEISEFNNLKSEVSELKEMMKIIISKLDTNS
jgi:acyl-CoA hydrolase